MRYMTRVIVLSVLAFLAGCPDDTPPNAKLIGGEKPAGKAVTIGGLGYIRSHDGKSDLEGIVKDTGGFPYVAGDTVTFYLDCAGQVPVAKFTPETDSTKSVNFFEHVDVDGANSQEQVDRLMILLVALDSDSKKSGVQIPERVCTTASAQAAGLLSVLKNNPPSTLQSSTAVEALLAALDDPATSTNEGKTTEDLPTLNEARAFFGLESPSYPYETVYGDVCTNSEPTPGCTFLRLTGARITVSYDPDYDQYGNGSDDLWYVKFNSSGQASIYDDLGNFQYNADISEFAGYVGGTTIGVGTTGYYWENVSNNTYWFGDNGVLYSAETGNSNYGQAIN